MSTADVRQVGPVRTFDDEMAEMTLRLPGFAGMYLDDAGGLVVRLKDPSRAAEAPGPMEDLLARVTHRGPLLAAERAALVAGMRVEPARYDFAELRGWDLLLAQSVLGMDEVNTSDIDEVRNRLAIGVRDAALIGRIEAAVRELPIPEDAVIVEVHGPGVISMAAAQTLGDSIRPVIGGLRISVEAAVGEEACTLGYNVTHVLSSGQEDPSRYFVTNSHCTPAFGAIDSDSDVWQPKPPYKIGVEVYDPPTFDHTDDIDCPVGRECRFSDASLFKYEASVTSSQGRIAWPDIDTTFTGGRSVGAVADPMVGTDVFMIGATSGRKMGKVKEMCMRVKQTYNLI